MSTTSNTNFQAIFNTALANYTKQTGDDLVNHPLVTKLQNCDDPDSILRVLQEQAAAFDGFRKGDPKLMKWLKPMVHGLQALSSSAILSEGTGLVFPPAQLIFSGIGALLTAAKDVSGSYDAIVDLFECMENFLHRLKIYIEVPSTPAMTGIIVNILVELLSVLALATKQIKQGRFKKYAKKLLGESEVEAVLQRLDRLTQEEARTTIAQTLEVVYGLVANIAVVMDDGKASTEGIRQALLVMQDMTAEINRMKRDQLQENVRRWLSGPDPSINHNIACRAHYGGTAMWFIESSTYKEWKTTGSLMWIHGKPGSGKSVLCSSIIEDIQRQREAGLAILTYFYVDFKDTAKQDFRNLLSSLLIQLGAQSDRFCDILSTLYSEHDRGLRQPRDDVLTQCLRNMFELPGQGPLYVIVDALDESPNSSGMPTPREQVLEVLEQFADLHLQHLHLCVTSRPEVDIQAVLEPLTAYTVSIHDERGQNQDIMNYIRSVVLSDSKMRRWREEDRKLVIDTLTQKAGGMFRWVACQLETLRRCFPQTLRRTLDDLPKTLDETYERALQGIDEEKWGYAYRLLQSLTVSVRSLRVEELAEVLAIQLDAEEIPEFSADWRPEDVEDAVLSACSSLISVVTVDDVRVVQFSHFTVKEFLTSKRLANSKHVSRYHILLQSAHTFLARACLSVLLDLDDRIDKTRIEEFPLARYAAEHWVDHAQLEDVSQHIQDGVKRLFDRDKPHFAAWVWVYDIDDPFGLHMYHTHPEKPDASPMYYAALCGLYDLTERLIILYPQDVNSRGGQRTTPLHAALGKERLEIAQLLLEHGADVNSKDDEGRAPLHIASQSGEVRIIQSLLDRGADPDAENMVGETPLYLASSHGRPGSAELLLDRGADVDHRSTLGWTSLHVASQNGYQDVARLLLDHNADAHAQQRGNRWTPLHLASDKGKLEVARLLLDRAADVDARDKWDWTSLHLASRGGHLDVLRLLLDRRADANAQTSQQLTPLHFAAYNGHLQVAEVLLAHGIDLQIRSKKDQTAFEQASEMGHLAVAQLLSDHANRGVDV